MSVSILVAALGLAAGATRVAAEGFRKPVTAGELGQSIWLPSVSRGRLTAEPRYYGPLPRPLAGPEQYRGCRVDERHNGRDSRIERRYDEEGYLASERFWLGDVPRNETRWFYDERRLLIRLERDESADGGVDSFQEYTYDVLGRLTRVDYYTGASGESDGYIDHAYTEGASLLTERVEFNGSDGVLGAVEEIDTQGGTEIDHRYDTDGDGNWNRRRRSYLNGSGLVERLETDYGADGSVERWSEFQYDYYGRPVYGGEYAWDDTAPHSTWVGYYGANGWRSQSDTYLNGILEYSVRHSWDAVGRSLALTSEHHAYGTLVTSYTYECP